MNWTTFSTLVTLTHKILKKFCRCSFSWSIVEFFKAVTFSSNWSIVRESDILWKLYIKKYIYVNVAIYNLPNSIQFILNRNYNHFPLNILIWIFLWQQHAYDWPFCHTLLDCYMHQHSLKSKIFKILSLRTCTVCIYQILHINANDFSALPVSNICQNCML